MQNLEVIPLLQSLNKGDAKTSGYWISVRTMEILYKSALKSVSLADCSKKKGTCLSMIRTSVFDK